MKTENTEVLGRELN